MILQNLKYNIFKQFKEAIKQKYNENLKFIFITTVIVFAPNYATHQNLILKLNELSEFFF